MDEYERLLKLFREEKQASEEFLTTGGAKDFATYREVVGVLRGLGTAIQITTDLLRRQTDDDDD